MNGWTGDWMGGWMTDGRTMATWWLVGDMEGLSVSSNLNPSVVPSSLWPHHILPALCWLYQDTLILEGQTSTPVA